MKIVVYSGAGGSGGLRGYIKGFLSACNVDMSVDVVVICTKNLHDYVSESASDNVRFIVNDKCAMKLTSYLTGNRLDKEIQYIIDTEKPDIVYYMNSIIHKGTEKFINIVGMHNQLYVDKKQLRRLKMGKDVLSLYVQRYFANKSMKSADAVVFDSHQSLNQCVEQHLPFKKGIIAYFGVQDDERSSIPHDTNINNTVEMLYVSTIYPYKNQMDLLDGIALLKRRGHSLKLHLVGSGPKKYITQLREKINFLELNDNVVMHSWLEHSKVKSMIDETDIFIYASSIETSGFGLMEGMVRGAVVVCNNESCMPEILGEGGLLFDVHSAVNTADVIEKLIRDIELRDKLSFKALEVSSRYTWKSHANQIFENFRLLMK